MVRKFMGRPVPVDFSPYGVDLFGDPIKPPGQAPLSERFLFPPFSVLDTRNGEWQSRKSSWLSLGIKSETGRGANLLQFSSTVLEPDEAKRKAAAFAPAFNPGASSDLEARYKANGLGANPPNPEMIPGYNDKLDQGMTKDEIVAEWVARGGTDGGTSIFDPVLCELAYRWWCPSGGVVIDPFAGGSVRGIVASMLGRHYWGSELREEQVAANIQQLSLCDGGPKPTWVCGDSRTTLSGAPEADFIFSCPPYGNLEVYSDDPRDLSAMEQGAFVDAYRLIVAGAAARLRQDRFACFVVGDYRDQRTGHYRGFVVDTILAFREAGMALYNHGILVTSVGSLPIRIAGQFNKGRKLGKTHQDVLVFVKGDPRKWTQEGR